VGHPRARRRLDEDVGDDFELGRRTGTLRRVKGASLAAAPMAAALAWTTALMADPGGMGSVNVLLVGLGLLGSSLVSTVGMIVVGGRWAHRLGLAALGLTVGVAVVRPIDPWWLLATGVTALGVVALASPALTRSIRRLPAATGPPPRAVIPPLLLLCMPVALGLLDDDSAVWALLVAGLSGPLVALLYSRVLPGGLVAMRLGWPLTTLALTPWLDPPTALTAVATAVAVAVISWHPSVAASYHPPREVGTVFPVPPELTPKAVLDAAELDDQGRAL